MCYSKGYKYSDGDVQTFSSAVSIQRAACETSYALKGGKYKRRTIKRRTNKRNKRTNRTIKRNKRTNKKKSKNITLY